MKSFNNIERYVINFIFQLNYNYINNNKNFHILSKISR